MAESKITIKPWGTSEELFYNRDFLLCDCHAKAGWSCSRHYHSQRANWFRVETGELVVHEFSDGKRIHSHILLPGQTCTIKAEVEHQFTAMKDTHFFEAYWPQEPGDLVNSSDIIRLSEGGLNF